MVLKRKLPTHQNKIKEAKKEEPSSNDFDMEIEQETSVKKTKVKKGLDLNDDFPQNVEETPEDFIPEELRVSEASSNGEAQVVEAKPKTVEEKPAVVKPVEDKSAPVGFEDEGFDMSFDDDTNEIPSTIEENMVTETKAAPKPVKPVKKEDDIKLKVAKSDNAPEDKAQKTPLKAQEAPAMDFQTEDPVNWEDIVENSNQEKVTTDSFEQIDWSNNEQPNKTVPEDRFNEAKPEDDDDFFVPELPGMDSYSDNKPAEVMGSESKDIGLNGEAKRKLVTGIIITAIIVGGIYIYSNKENTTIVANRLSGALSEVSQDIAQNDEENDEFIKQGLDITPAEKIIDLELLDSEDGEDDSSFGSSDSSAIDAEATKIDLLEPEVIEKTAAGKEIITATGDEELPEEIKEGVSLLKSVSDELQEKRTAKERLVDAKKEIIDPKKQNAADLNKEVDAQLAEYRKILAEEKNPGKKVKPSDFFNGTEAQNSGEFNEQRTVISKVNLDEGSYAEVLPEGYRATASQVEGHQIVEYPTAKAKEVDEGIRTLDHFRSLIIEKQDDRVRMPSNIAPSVRFQGFPKFKVISIVPNYGLIGEYDDKKGSLVVGDSFKGWELIAVYETYAEFKSGSRTHVITLK